MKEAEIKHQRVAARLKELVAEAVATLNDDRISGLAVLDVKITRGMYDADVYIDGTDISKEDRQKFQALLSKASGYIQRYCLSCEDWYKVPKLHFKFDDTIGSLNKIDELFDKISKKK
ncbi:MAG: ribosome-binding factor [Campylobacterota bacterium]|nr:ribosome-binding factor [Campylobacterota bacterium]